MSDSFDDAPLWSEREREQASEIDRLTALLGETNDALAACQSEGEAWKRLAQEAGDCLSEANHWREGLAGVELDATRYRWIRRHNKVGGKVTVELECDPPELCTCETGHKPHELDAAIDTRMTTATAPAAHGPEWDATRRQQGYIDRSDEIDRQLTGSASLNQENER